MFKRKNKDGEEVYEGSKLKPISSISQLIASYNAACYVEHVRQEQHITKTISVDTKLFMQKFELDLIEEDKLTASLYLRFLELKCVRYNPRLAAIFKIGIEDMYYFKFKESASVTSNTKDKHLINQFSFNTFELLKQVTLFDHTLHVVEFLIEQEEQAETINGAVNILSGLFHDYGKSEKIRAEFNQAWINPDHKSTPNHWDIDYARSLLKPKVKRFLTSIEEDPEVDLTIDAIHDIVANHHNAAKNYESKISAVKTADTEARKREISSLSS